ncbi:MAG: TetR/AcrR family transcriptional regulator [Gordonia polyisoprenivorans]|nr:TetR/AcrR family transcriptional regulator [Gordonia polyisoprenivorans]
MGHSEPVLPRRVPWSSADTTSGPRDRIIVAASRCLADVGLERTSISEIARRAGVSRQTIYNHFAERDEIVAAAIGLAAAEASERIIARVRQQASAADFVVELCVAALDEFTHNPAIRPMISLLEQPGARSSTLTPEVIAYARGFLEPVLDHEPHLADGIDEMTETFLRFELSLLTLDSATTRSPDAIRGYLHRVLVPALGLTPSPSH